MDTEKIQTALHYLKKKRKNLTVQQFRAFKGQILAGDVVGAIRGIDRLLKRKKKVGRYYAV